MCDLTIQRDNTKYVTNSIKSCCQQVAQRRIKGQIKKVYIMITRFYRKFRNLILYGIIGSCTSTLDFLFFMFLSKFLGIYYLVANCISVLVGITISFILNRLYNFKVKTKTKKRFAIFLTVGLCGLCLSNFILWICIDFLEFEKLLSKLASIVLVVICQYLFNKYVTFRTK